MYASPAEADVVIHGSDDDWTLILTMNAIPCKLVGPTCRKTAGLCASLKAEDEALSSFPPHLHIMAESSYTLTTGVVFSVACVLPSLLMW